jgi:hypothetical protein
VRFDACLGVAIAKRHVISTELQQERRMSAEWTCYRKQVEFTTSCACDMCINDLNILNYFVTPLRSPKSLPSFTPML